MEGSCPVCYESYSADGGNIARRLACGHVICYCCIAGEIFDRTYYCPECASKHAGDIEEFSCLATEEDVTTANNDEEVLVEDPVNDSMDTLALQASMQPRLSCIVENCTNKAISTSGLCLHHSKRRHKSMATAGRVAKDISNTSFHSISAARGNLLADSTKLFSQPLSPDELIEKFKDQKRIELGEAMQLIDEAKRIMIKESNVLQLSSPLVAVGDVHGQFYDLLNLLAEGGKPGDSEQYLFLGDYVDRGSFSCEVLFLLIALKVKYPTKIWLLRGNHECASVSGHFGFKEECKKKYGVNVYYNCLLLFQTMPLAAIISTDYGQIFACHGGLSPSLNSIEDINKLNRLFEPESVSSILDLIWSDPVSEENLEELSDEAYEEFMNIRFKSNPARGCSYTFGYKALREFLDNNNLVCIIRAHEVQQAGFRRHFEPEDMESRLKQLVMNRREQVSNSGKVDSCEIVVGKQRNVPPLITVFSAPNYCDRYENMGAILRIDRSLAGFRVIQYPCVEHPVPEITESQTDNYILAITAACPYMPTSFKAFVRRALELGFENLVDTDAIEGEESNVSINEHADICEQVVEPNSLGSETKFILETPRRPHQVELSTPRHSDYDLSNDADIARHLREFPVRRSSVKPNFGNIADPATDSTQAPRGMLRRRSSVTISMARAPNSSVESCSDDAPDDYNCQVRTEQCLSYGSERKFVPSSCQKEGNIFDEFGLEMHEDISLDESSPTKTKVPVSQTLSNDNNIVMGRPSASARLFNSFEDSDAASPILSLPRQTTIPRHYIPYQAVSDSPYLKYSASSVSNLSSQNNQQSSSAKFSLSSATFSSTPQSTRSGICTKFAAMSPIPCSQTLQMPQTKINSSAVKSFPQRGFQTPSNSIRRTNSNYNYAPSGAYLEAHASDSINEIHPEMLKQSTPLASTVQENYLKFKELIHRDLVALSTNVSVKDIKKKFENSPAKPPVSSEFKNDPYDEFLPTKSDTNMNGVAALSKVFGGSGPVRKFERQSVSVDAKCEDKISSPVHRLQNHQPLEIANITEDSKTPANQDELIQSSKNFECADDDDTVMFTTKEILALKLMFSLFDRTGSDSITYDDLVAYGEETGGEMVLRHAATALEIVDIDGDGKISLLDFIHFAARLKAAHDEIVY